MNLEYLSKKDVNPLDTHHFETMKDYHAAVDALMRLSNDVEGDEHPDKNLVTQNCLYKWNVFEKNDELWMRDIHENFKLDPVEREYQKRIYFSNLLDIEDPRDIIYTTISIPREDVYGWEKGIGDELYRLLCHHYHICPNSYLSVGIFHCDDQNKYCHIHIFGCLRQNYNRAVRHKEVVESLGAEYFGIKPEDAPYFDFKKKNPPKKSWF